MKIENVTVETSRRYVDGDEEVVAYNSRQIDILRLEIPVPGGKVSYEIDLPTGVKDSIEKASSIIKVAKV